MMCTPHPVPFITLWITWAKAPWLVPWFTHFRAKMTGHMESTPISAPLMLARSFEVKNKDIQKLLEMPYKATPYHPVSTVEI